MSKYKHILFDLDGTITEPVLGITNGIVYALESLGIKVEDTSMFRRFIGPPLRDSFKNYLGFSEELTAEAVALYRQYYSEKGLKENELMPDMGEAIKALNSQGYRLYLATSKPEKFAKMILEDLGVMSYFTIAAGADLHGNRETKEEVMEYLIEQIREATPDFEIKQAIMVGDRLYDINGAKYFGMDSLGVTFGYGDYKELSDAGATYIVDNAKALIETIMTS